MVEWLLSLGVRSDLAIAATFGAGFLVFVRHLTPRQSMGAFAAGIGTALYLTPLTVRALFASFTWFPTDVQGERAVALFWGLLGSFVLAGLIVLGERWKKDPVSTIKELKQ